MKLAFLALWFLSAGTIISISLRYVLFGFGIIEININKVTVALMGLTVICFICRDIYRFWKGIK
jgi:hypothetical protein